MASNQKQYVAFIVGFDLFPISSVSRSFANKVGIPETYMHFGIAVYNRLFHFTQDGIHVEYKMPKSYKILRSNDSSAFQLTNITFQDFDRWMLKQTQEKFRTYDLQRINCICFAEAVCTYLKIHFEVPECLKLKGWLANSAVTPLLEHIRTNPIQQYLSRASSKFLHPTTEEVSVHNTIVELCALDIEMERRYIMTLSGGVYNKGDASVKPSPF